MTKVKCTHCGREPISGVAMVDIPCFKCKTGKYEIVQPPPQPLTEDEIAAAIAGGY